MEEDIRIRAVRRGDDVGNETGRARRRERCCCCEREQREKARREDERV